MCGRRCKALREHFRSTHGRPPSIVSIAEGSSAGYLLRRGIHTRRFVSEWRRIKKAYTRHLDQEGQAQP